MTPFAGYDMPLQYAGIIAEHRHCRARAALFDVSHMGQAELTGPDAAAALETLVPGDLLGLADGAIRYTLFTNEAGGILDDLMVTRRGDGLFLVVNAACKDQDFAHMAHRLEGRATLKILSDRALLALQGPEAATVLGRLAPEAIPMGFMTARDLTVDGIPCQVSRSGYTGEDGYEISVPADRAEALARRLLAQPEVAPVGLGARDTLRLEAGLCLYGSDIDTTTTPIEAALAWTIGKRRREQGGFPGAAVILDQLKTGPARKRVGLRPEGKAPARAHTEVTDAAGRRIGEITSGGYGPTVGGPVAMGYVETGAAGDGSEVRFVVRGSALPGRVVKLPFAPHRYHRA
ncbi:MAG: glycine cleavage system aminomethyltransferase GcvT [Magnetospirillum sp. WYHS-4]